MVAPLQMLRRAPHHQPSAARVRQLRRMPRVLLILTPRARKRGTRRRGETEPSEVEMYHRLYPTLEPMKAMATMVWRMRKMRREQTTATTTLGASRCFGGFVSVTAREGVPATAVRPPPPLRRPRPYPMTVTRMQRQLYLSEGAITRLRPSSSLGIDLYPIRPLRTSHPDASTPTLANKTPTMAEAGLGAKEATVTAMRQRRQKQRRQPAVPATVAAEGRTTGSPTTAPAAAEMAYLIRKKSEAASRDLTPPPSAPRHFLMRTTRTIILTQTLSSRRVTPSADNEVEPPRRRDLSTANPQQEQLMRRSLLFRPQLWLRRCPPSRRCSVTSPMMRTFCWATKREEVWRPHSRG